MSTLATAGATQVLEFADDVRRDLARTPKQLQSKYLYDALGLRLFEAICRLPWYRITRAENALLRQHAGVVIHALHDPATITELGCGSGHKLSILAEAVQRAGRSVRVHLIDVSTEALALSERSLGRLEHVSLVGHESTYEIGLARVVAQRDEAGSMLVLFLGSNIGNFDQDVAGRFLLTIRQALRPRDTLLVGTDLTKPEVALRLAYDDPLGVTAAFNKNLLVRINRELQADFDLERFQHHVVWNPDESRIELHLKSTCDQVVRIAAVECEVAFATGETIWTENSHKYELADVGALAEAAGFEIREQWLESDARFALTLFAVA